VSEVRVRKRRPGWARRCGATSSSASTRRRAALARAAACRDAAQPKSDCVGWRSVPAGVAGFKWELTRPRHRLHDVVDDNVLKAFNVFKERLVPLIPFVVVS